MTVHQRDQALREDTPDPLQVKDQAQRKVTLHPPQVRDTPDQPHLRAKITLVKGFGRK